MTRRLILALVGLMSAAGGLAAAEPRKPNVIVILIDDTGYADIGAYGGKDIPTPNIDSMAKNGVRFTNGYVSCPYCSPTRAGLMTGRYQTRFGHEFNEGGADRDKFGLPLTETTFAQRMKALGYATAAIGKWHLGSNPEFRPTARGFDEFYGTLANTPFYRPMLLDSRVGPDPKRVEADGFYTTDAYGDRAVEIIKAHAARPFFLYLPFNANHVPSQATQEYLKRFPEITAKDRLLYAGMMSALDDAVGRVLAALRESKLEEDTLIFFLSDNGGPMTKMGANGSNNKPLKGQKGDTWEGAIRVPWMVQWKGHLPAGKVYDHPVISLDILPTAVAAAGGRAEAEADWKLDGVNLLPYLGGEKAEAPHAALYWRFGPQWAVRKGDWKLIRGYDYDAQAAQPAVAAVKVTPPMLFNLRDDVGETKDLAAANPDEVKRLQADWDAWNGEQKDPLWVPRPRSK